MNGTWKLAGPVSSAALQQLCLLLNKEFGVDGCFHWSNEEKQTWSLMLHHSAPLVTHQLMNAFSNDLRYLSLIFLDVAR